MERSGKIYFYLYNGHGSVRGLIDADGNITDTYCYDAFGNLLGKTGSTENSYLYCGEQQDDTTGLYYLRARYMNPATGTFTSMDTYGGSVFDPTSIHKYLYANANPVSYTDPSGYFSLGEVVTTMAISSVLGGIAGAGIGAGIEILRQLAINPDFTALGWNKIGKAAVTGLKFGLLIGALAGLAQLFVWASALFSIVQVGFGVLALKAAASDLSTYHNWKLVALNLTLALVCFVGAGKTAAKTKSLYDAKQAAKTQQAAKTADTATDTSPENTNTAESNIDEEKPFLPEEYYTKKIEAEWTKDGVKYHYYQEPNTARITYRIGSRTHSFEKSVTVSDEFGRIKYRIDYSDHGMPEAHTNPHIHEYEINTSGTSNTEDGILFFPDDNSAYVDPNPPPKPLN